MDHKRHKCLARMRMLKMGGHEGVTNGVERLS